MVWHLFQRPGSYTEVAGMVKEVRHSSGELYRVEIVSDTGKIYVFASKKPVSAGDHVKIGYNPATEYPEGDVITLLKQPKLKKLEH